MTINEQEAYHEHGVAAVTCLLSGLQIFDSAYDKQNRYHRVVKGLHGFHVYATEYWTEYLLSRAKHMDGLETDSLLFTQACQMAEVLSATASVMTIEPVAEAPSNILDERLELLQTHPILYKHVKAALEARSVKRLEYEILQLTSMY